MPPKDPAAKRAARKRHYDANREKELGASRAWNAANPGRHSANSRRSALLRDFALTPEDYAALLIEQGGVCAICSAPPGTRSLCVDHDHTTGAIRGLLCGPCNRGIGLLRDDPAVLRAAIGYLTR